MVEKRIVSKLREDETGKRKIPKNDKRFLNPEQAVTDGLRGEIAVARYLKLKWFGELSSDDNIRGDLEFGIEVKATSNPRGNLYCSQKTYNDYMRRSPNTPIVLARVDAWPWTELPGWIFAKDLILFPFNRSNARHNSGYLVPVKSLSPLNELEDLIKYWHEFNSKNQK